MILFIKIFLCFILYNNHTRDYKVLIQGDVAKGGNTRLLVVDKKGSIAQTYAIKSFVICIKRCEQINDRPYCYSEAGNSITDDFKSTVINQLPHGNYQLIISDLICGPVSEKNTDVRHFKLKDYEFKIQL